MLLGFRCFEATRDMRIIFERPKTTRGVIAGKDPNVATKHRCAKQRDDATKGRADPTSQDAEDTEVAVVRVPTKRDTALVARIVTDGESDGGRISGRE